MKEVVLNLTGLEIFFLVTTILSLLRSLVPLFINIHKVPAGRLEEWEQRQ